VHIAACRFALRPICYAANKAGDLAAGDPDEIEAPAKMVPFYHRPRAALPHPHHQAMFGCATRIGPGGGMLPVG
jgi:hypothetical protein